MTFSYFFFLTFNTFLLARGGGYLCAHYYCIFYVVTMKSQMCSTKYKNVRLPPVVLLQTVRNEVP